MGRHQHGIDQLDLKLWTPRSTGRMVSMTAYEAGGTASLSDI
jgi:hypothetical protein